MKREYFLFFSIFIYFIQISRINGQYYINLDSVSLNVIQALNPNDICTGLTSIRFSTPTTFIEINDFQINTTEYGSPDISMIPQKSITNQVFTFYYKLKIGATKFDLKIVNETKFFNSSFSIPIDCSVFTPDRYQLSSIIFPSHEYFQTRRSLLFADFNSISTFLYVGITCDLGSSLYCTLLPEKNNFHFPSKYLGTISLAQPSIPPVPKLGLTIGIGYVTDVYEIDNPYPYDVIRTTKLNSITAYPPNGYQIKEDFRLLLQSDFFNEQYITLENVNSVLYLTAPYDYILVQKNSTHSQYGFQGRRYYSSSYSSYFLDSVSTNIYNYSSTSKMLGVSTMVSAQGGLDIAGDFMYIISEFPLKYIFNYDYIVKLYETVLDTYIWQPYSSNYSDISLNYFKYQNVFPISPYYNGYAIVNYKPYGSDQTVQISASKPSVTNLTVNSIYSVTISPTTILVTISLSSEVPIVYMLYGSTPINSSNLVYGNETNGVYEKEIPLTYFITDPVNLEIHSLNGEIFIFNQGLVYNDKFDMFYPANFDNSLVFYLSDVTYFKFDKEVVDISNGTAYNTLFFNLSRSTPILLPCISFDENLDSKFIGAYDNDLELYVINFTVNSWITNPEFFYLYDIDLQYFFLVLESKNLYSYFTNFSKFTILNQNAERIPPKIEQLYSFQNESSIGWTMVISDQINGFHSGSIEVVSNIDFNPRIINFNASDRVSGDKFFGTYNFTFNIDNWQNCRSQNYSIRKVLLSDGSPLPFEDSDRLKTIFGTHYENNCQITFNCSVEVNDIAPYLVDFIKPSIVQVGGYNRSIEISFTTTGINGISERHNPIIVLQSENLEVFQIQSELDTNNGTHFNYVSKAQLPYGFGVNRIFISVYGIVDRLNNYKSYTFLDLRSMGIGPIVREFNNTIPVLEKSTNILSSGGPLTIYGRSLGYQAPSITYFINYQNGDGYQPILPFFNSSTIAQFEKINEIKSQYFTIQVQVNGIYSNELNIYPISTFKLPVTTPNNTQSPSPTPTPTQTSNPYICPGTPQCNNRGICKTNVGCECESPWYGPSCSSKVIIIPKPDPQPEPSTGVNITGNGNSLITTMVDIIEIREIDSTDNIINRFSILNWNLTDLSILENPTYIYDTILNGTSTTIQTNITFFKKETNVTFGDQLLLMQASSIKFSIQISSYQFKQKTNFLQIIMESTIKGSNQDSCSSSQFGSQNNTKDNIQWIKMNIDKTSLYGRFIDFGIVDNRITSISNKILEDDESQTTQFRSIQVGITVPYFEESVYLDPDFSNLIDVGDNDVDLMCKSKKKLSSGAIAGIVVGSVVFLSLVVAITIFIHRKTKVKRENKRVQNKLKNMK